MTRLLSRFAEPFSVQERRIGVEDSVRVLIPDAETFDGLKVLRCLAQHRKMRVYALSRDPRALTRYSRYCAGMYSSSARSEDDWLKHVVLLSKKLSADVVFPVTENAILLMASQRDRFNANARLIPLPDPADMRRVRNKLRFHEFARAHGLPVLSWMDLRTALDPDQQRDGSRLYPAVIKPAAASGGGRGIIRVAAPCELRRAVAETGAPPEQWNQWFLQAYVEGTDICVQFLAQRGEIRVAAVQSAVHAEAGYFGPQRIMTISADPEPLALARRTVRALNWTGIACLDLRRTPDGKLHILEMNPRAGQALLGLLAAGVNLPLLAVHGALGRAISVGEITPITYAHPMAYLRNALRNHSGLELTWRNSGLRYALVDPLPEMVHALRRWIRRRHAAGHSVNSRLQRSPETTG